MPVGYTTVSAGFEVGADSYIDRRLLLTKEQMRGAYDEWFMPPIYIAYCLDDKQWYEYNEENEEDAETGYYRPIPSGIVKDVRIEGVSILDSEGIADFEFPVKDVLVDGVSVVENKRAQIDLSNFQEKLRAGENITIEGNVINSTTKVLEGNGIKVDSEGHISIDPEIVPEKDELEDLVEQLGFVTADALNTVLNNYYTDSETYNKTEVNDLISSIAGGIELEVVAVLPIVGESNKIYLVRREVSSNVYDQYVWFNNNWVQVGSTEVDLSQYYTKTEVDDLLDDKQDKLTEGTGIVISRTNVISVDTSDLPTATASTAGLIKIDNETIKKNPDGQIYAVNGGGGGGGTYLPGEGIYFSNNNTTINAEAYTAGPGVKINNAKQISAKVDDTTIHTNSYGELYMDAVPIDAGQGIKIQGGTISINPPQVADAIDLQDYQKKLIAGTNIIIDPTTNVISATGGGGGSEYGPAEWGHISGTLSNQPDLWAALQGKANVSQIPTNVSQLTNDVPYATQAALNNMGLTKQDKLTAGANITISADNVISATGGGGGDEVNWTDLVGDPMSNPYLAAEINNAKVSPTVNDGSFIFKANGTPVGGGTVNQSGTTSFGVSLQKNGTAITPTIASGNATYNIKMPIFSYDESTGVLSITDN